VFNRGLLVNKALFLASAASITATLLIIYTPLSAVFETVALGPENWLIALYASLVIIAVFDVLKTINNRTGFFLHHIH
jgi:hypothetical protein